MPRSRNREGPKGSEGRVGPRAEMPAKVGIQHQDGAGETASANHRRGRRKVPVSSRKTSAAVNLWGASPYVGIQTPDTDLHT